MRFEEVDERHLFPYLLVNIGSGVSILKVTGENQFQRVSGTSCGGGTLWGLLSLLTPANTYDEMLELSETGDNRNVDMLVGDIYGDNYSKIGLKASTIASSFGKVFKSKHKGEQKDFSPNDIAKSLLYMVSNTIAQIAYLNAKIHGVERIFFGGSYIRGHPETMKTLSFAVNFWSSGSMKAFFLRHEGYLGAVGAFLKGNGFVQSRKTSFLENFTRPLFVASKRSTQAVGSIDMSPTKFSAFPLLFDVMTYNPDIVDLGSADMELTNYWIDLLEKNMSSLTDMALRNVKRDDTLEKKIDAFKRVFSGHLSVLRKDPTSYGALNLRRLLSLREQCLHEVGLPDIFEASKHEENEAALQALPSFLARLDQIPEEDMLLQIVQGVLGGNMFDWGSSQILELVRQNKLSFQSAREIVRFAEKYNNFDAFKNRVTLGHQYKKIIIFVDNSGADCILGILPFVRFFVKRGAKVVIAANSEPAVNDITASELCAVMDRVVDLDDCLGKAWMSRTVDVVGTGNGSPCIDLRRISEECVQAAQGVDLVVLEGMGRAIHTNLHSRFKCDSLKIAVVKNSRLAEMVGAKLYDGLVVFQSADDPSKSK